MPDVNDLKRFLKIEDLTLNDDVVIKNEGVIREFEFENKQTKQKETGKALEIGVSVNGDFTKPLTFNKLSIQSLTDSFGSKTSNWVNRRCVVKEASTMSFGKLLKVKYLESVGGVVAADKPEPSEPQFQD